MVAFDVGTAFFQLLSLIMPLLIICLIIFVVKFMSKTSKLIKTIETQNSEILGELNKINNKLDK